MTGIDKLKVKRYLRNLTFTNKEFYEEMYDHICSSYENRDQPNQSVEAHILRVIEPSFGGKKGMRKVQQSQAQMRKKIVYKRALELYASYLFKWPTVLTTVIILLVLFLLSQVYSGFAVFEISTMIGLITPFLLSQYGKWRFERECKIHQLPYNDSQVNNTIQFLSVLGVALLYGFFSIVNRLVFGNPKGFFEFFAQYPISYLPVSMLIIVYAMVCVQLFKENFYLKLA